MKCTLRLAGGPFDGFEQDREKEPSSNTLFIWLDESSDLLYMVSPTVLLRFIRANSVRAKALYAYTFRNTHFLTDGQNQERCDMTYKLTRQLDLVQDLSKEDLY